MFFQSSQIWTYSQVEMILQALEYETGNSTNHSNSSIFLTWSSWLWDLNIARLRTVACPISIRVCDLLISEIAYMRWCLLQLIDGHTSFIMYHFLRINRCLILISVQCVLVQRHDFPKLFYFQSPCVSNKPWKLERYIPWALFTILHSVASSLALCLIFCHVSASNYSCTIYVMLSEKLTKLEYFLICRAGKGFGRVLWINCRFTLIPIFLFVKTSCITHSQLENSPHWCMHGHCSWIKITKYDIAI